MLQNIRDNAQGPIAKVIVGIMVVPFVFFGIDSFFNGSSEKVVAEVGGEEITERQVLAGIEQEKIRLQNQFGDAYDPNIITDGLLKPQVMERLLQRTLLTQQADEFGMAASDSLLDQQIVAQEAFQTDGAFDPERYELALRGVGLTINRHRQTLREDLRRAHFVSGFTDTEFTTLSDLESSAKISDERRDIRYVTIPAVAREDLPAVADADAQAFYEENADQFQVPEQVQVEYVELTLQDFYQEPDEADVLSAYNAEKDAFKGDVETELAHILIETNESRDESAAKALGRDIKARLDKGEDFAALAKELSDDPGSAESGGLLGTVTIGMFPEFDDALNTLEEGGVSDPVASASGWHVLKAVSQTRTEFASFDESKQRIADELRRAGALPAFVEGTDVLDEQSFGADDLSAAAQAVGKTVQTSEFFSETSGSGIASSAAIRAVVFDPEFRKEGQNSPKIEIDDERVAIVRIKEIKPAAAMPFDTVVGQIKGQLQNERLAAATQTKAEAVMAEVLASGSVESAAKAAELEWQSQSRARRSSLSVDRSILESAFSQEEFTDGVSVAIASLANGDKAVVQISNVVAGRLSDLPLQERQGLGRSYAQLAGNRAFDDYFTGLRNSSSVNISE